MRRPGWSLHCCALDRECRRDIGERVWRVHVSTPWWHLGVALTPDAKYIHRRRPAGWETRRMFFRRWSRNGGGW